MKKILLVFVSLIFASVVSAAGSPYLAAAVNGNKTSSAMSATPGKAPFFIIYDEKGVYLETVANPYKDEEGAGPMAINMLKEKGIKVFAAENFPGERFKGFLKSKGVSPAVFKGTADNAAKSLIKKK
ncbi:NifB/NifX family molybdenum-iron cluster-binding protein [Seleniivibrio woodruffii]|uniref:NifB/NifX family molybdenum-iron cluster-binding protein n=1 Tax=Seleniivibrio woodruffii TaxID=1078050 RepID=UPI0026F27084|nr:NifB/NifX family molybdenum-iron cluster-binding protein [Seleniivibrio woodruffii]